MRRNETENVKTTALVQKPGSSASICCQKFWKIVSFSCQKFDFKTPHFPTFSLFWPRLLSLEGGVWGKSRKIAAAHWLRTRPASTSGVISPSAQKKIEISSAFLRAHWFVISLKLHPLMTATWAKIGKKWKSEVFWNQIFGMKMKQFFKTFDSKLKQRTQAFAQELWFSHFQFHFASFISRIPAILFTFSFHNLLLLCNLDNRDHFVSNLAYLERPEIYRPEKFQGFWKGSGLNWPSNIEKMIA